MPSVGSDETKVKRTETADQKARRLARSRAWRAANPEYFRNRNASLTDEQKAAKKASARAYGLAHPDKRKGRWARMSDEQKTAAKAKSHQWVLVNPEKRREIARQWAAKWRAANPEKAKAATDKWLARQDPAYKRDTSRKWRYANPERAKTKTERWRAANPEKVSLMKHRSKLKMFGLTPAQYDLMFRLQNGVCAACLKPPTTERLAVDHAHDATKRVRALVHSGCNATKIGSNTIETARRVLAILESDFDGRTLLVDAA